MNSPAIERSWSARSKLKLKPEDDEYIKARGTEIYSELEEKRKSLGLDPFDNSVPQIVKNYHDEATRDLDVLLTTVSKLASGRLKTSVPA